MINKVHYISEIVELFENIEYNVYKDCVFTKKDEAYKLCRQLQEENDNPNVEYEVCSFWVDRLNVD